MRTDRARARGPHRIRAGTVLSWPATHLTAHLETAEALTSEQIARYGHLRGYEHSGHDHGHRPEEAPRLP